MTDSELFNAAISYLETKSNEVIGQGELKGYMGCDMLGRCSANAEGEPGSEQYVKTWVATYRYECVDFIADPDAPN